MKVYRNTKVHLVIGLITILGVVVAGTLMGLSTVTTGVIFLIASVAAAVIIYFATRRIHKHDDDIHYHEKDSSTMVRH